MMVFLALLLSAIPSLHADTREPVRMIYGNDDRQDLCEVHDPQIRQWADSTALIVNAARLASSTDNKTQELRLLNYQAAFRLCSEERFLAQPTVVSNCSGALVGQDLLLTVGHCMRDLATCQNS